MNLHEFRILYPLKPYDRAYLRGDGDKVMKEVEIISFPFEVDFVPPQQEVRIKIRMVPDDPDTLAETEVSNLIRIPKLVKCDKHMTQPFVPKHHRSSAYCEDQDAMTVTIDCPHCFRGYSYITGLMKGEMSRNRQVGEWYSDRPLIILE